MIVIVIALLKVIFTLFSQHFLLYQLLKKYELLNPLPIVVFYLFY